MMPKEINYKIAHIKNIGVEYIDNQTGTVIDSDERGHNWAENIADAWELFEEMPGSKSIHDEITMRYGVTLTTDIRKPGDMRSHIFTFYGLANTAPLAICKAWLAWKESKS